jgi:hypothetical protein
MSDSITFKFTLTEEDFVQASHVHALSHKKWWITWAVFFGLWILPLAAVTLDTAPGDDLLYRILPFLAGVASVAALFALAWFWQPRRAARGSPYLGVEMAGVASGDGLAMDSPLGKQQAAWASYATALESADLFLLYLAKNSYAPLPKRAFANREDLGRFRELIRANISSATLLD